MKSSNKLSDKILQDLNAALADAVKNDDIKSVKQALAAGASVETVSENYTVLYRTVSNFNLQIAELLLLEGADPNTNVGGNAASFALHRATSDQNIRMIKLLLDFGANIEIEDNNKKTPMQIARSLNSKACTAVFLDYLVERRVPAQCYFNRGKKVVMAAIDRDVNSWNAWLDDNIHEKKRIKALCESQTSLRNLISALEKNLSISPVVKELQLQENLDYLRTLLKLESKAFALDKKPDAVISSTSDVNKTLSLVSVKPSAPAASTVEEEAARIKVSKADQPESSSMYPKLFEVSASSVAVKTETRSADLQKSASCKF